MQDTSGLEGYSHHSGFRKQLGGKGEELARKYLHEKGYRWIASNFSTLWGEIDLIMEEGETLVFVEVKSRRDKKYGLPEEAITPIKIRHLVRSALYYIQKTGSENKMVRFDVIAMDEQGLRHYPDAFSPGDGYYY